jgi:hypothetical protein
MTEADLDAAAEGEWRALVMAMPPDMPADLVCIVRSAFLAGFMVGTRWLSRKALMQQAHEPGRLN